MDSCEDPNKLSSSHHDPTTTQPLLSKPYPALEPTRTSTSEADAEQSQFFQISYNYGPRSLKDLPFLLIFWLLVLCTFGFGIFASFHRNLHHSQVSDFVYNATSSSCASLRDFRNPISSHPSKSNIFSSLSENSTFSDSAPSLNLSKLSLSKSIIEKSSFSGEPFSLTFSKSTFFNSLLENLSFLDNPISVNSSKSSLLESLIWTLVITLVLSVPFVFLVLLLLKHYSKQIVYASLPFFIVVPVFINAYWFVACTVSSSCSHAFPIAYRILVLIFVFLIIGIIVWIFVVNWHRIELTVNIIGVASDALSKNLGLFGVLPALTFVLFVFYAPIVVFLILARLNGKIVPKEKNGEFYCVWKQDSWVPAYYALAILTMLWSATTMVEAQVYVISGTIAQWYFSDDDVAPKRGIRSSLRNAFGHSAGTICLSGLVMSVVRLVRSMVDNAREDAPGIVNLVLRCCVKTLLSAVDFLNKFTINFAAITGESYFTSARMTYELLKRNLLSTVFVETVSTRILAGIVFVLSSIYAILVCVLLKAAIRLGSEAYFVALMSWILLIVILGFFVHVLDNVIDTVYVCYAVDRDKGEVSKQEVHEVYVQLPISRSHRAGFADRTSHIV